MHHQRSFSARSYLQMQRNRDGCSRTYLHKIVVEFNTCIFIWPYIYHQNIFGLLSVYTTIIIMIIICLLEATILCIHNCIQMYQISYCSPCIARNLHNFFSNSDILGLPGILIHIFIEPQQRTTAIFFCLDLPHSTDFYLEEFVFVQFLKRF